MSEALKTLKGYFHNKRAARNFDVYCQLHHVSRSGMSRDIDFYIVRDGEMLRITGLIEDTLDMRPGKNGRGLRVHGCGMDMGFHVVYNLSHVLFAGTDRGSKAKPGPGYVLRHRWM